MLHEGLCPDVVFPREIKRDEKPKLDKYKKMLKVVNISIYFICKIHGTYLYFKIKGVPDDAVRATMLVDGINPDILLPSTTVSHIEKRYEKYTKMLRAVNILN